MEELIGIIFFVFIIVQAIANAIKKGSQQSTEEWGGEDAPSSEDVQRRLEQLLRGESEGPGQPPSRPEVVAKAPEQPRRVSPPQSRTPKAPPMARPVVPPAPLRERKEAPRPAPQPAPRPVAHQATPQPEPVVVRKEREARVPDPAFERREPKRPVKAQPVWRAPEEKTRKPMKAAPAAKSREPKARKKIRQRLDLSPAMMGKAAVLSEIYSPPVSMRPRRDF